MAAVLAADMVGFSRLMEADEVGTLERQKAHRRSLVDPAIAKFRGRMVKEMGDGVLVEFPSVVDAVSFAVEIQRAMPLSEAGRSEAEKISYRIGINLGDVIVDDGDIYGDGVNVAARLEQLADPDGICISGTVFDHMKNQVDVGYEPLGDVEVKNISQPVRSYRVVLDGSGSARAAKPRNRWRIGVSLGLICLAVGVGGWWYFGPSTAPEPVIASASSATGEAARQLSDRPSIAVLPFDNLGASEDEDYFSDGMTEDLITDLSQISGLLVIARNTVFTYKGRAVNVSNVGRELGVSHVLEGSVRRDGNRVRINAQLIDTVTGGHVWAARYDRELRDVFALQDDVVQRIVQALAVTLQAHETQRLASSKQVHPEAYDNFLRGLELLRRFSPETNLQARRYFQRATVLDPGFTRAHADVALTYMMEAEQQWTDNPVAAAQTGLAIALHAESQDENNPQVQFALSGIYRTLLQVEKSIDAAQLAVQVDPNYADGYATLASSFAFAGRIKESKDAIAQAKVLNPVGAFFFVWIDGLSDYIAGNFEVARTKFEAVIHSNPEFTAGHKMLAATYVELGLLEDAEWAAHELLTTSPDFSVSVERDTFPISDPATKDRYINALRTAGLN